MFAIFEPTSHSWLVKKPRFASLEDATVHALDEVSFASRLQMAGQCDFHIIDLRAGRSVKRVNMHGFFDSNLDVSNYIERWKVR